MSQIKEVSKQFTAQAKKYGYEIKHTHALELVSQILNHSNRHVALKEESSQKNTVPSLMKTFSLANFKPTIQLPFFEAYVLEVDLGDDQVEFVVTDTLGTAFELMGEIAYGMEYIKVLSPEDLNNKVRKYSEEESDQEDEDKTIMEWILAKHKSSKSNYFTVFNDY